MEAVLELGSIRIPYAWIYIAVGLLTAFLAINLRLKKTNFNKKQITDTLFNAVFYGFLGWKLSYVLFYPQLALANPLGILYFSGGQKGIIVGIVIGFLYLFVQSKKQKIALKRYLELFLLGLIVGSITFFLFTSFSGEKNGMRNGLTYGSLAPEFELESLDGTTVKLSDFQGEKVIVNFWATWCPPCRVEMPHMQDFYEKQKENGVTILAVNLTTRERDKRDVQSVVEEYPLSFPILLDVEGHVGNMYQANLTPTTYFIDTEGVIQQKVIGPLSYERIDAIIQSLN